MRSWTNPFLFVSAYSPLLAILAIQHASFTSAVFWIIMGLLVVVNLLWLPIFSIAKKWTKTKTIVGRAKNRTSDSLNYIVAYVIAFVGLQLNKPTDWLTLAILLLVVYIIYIHSELIFVNPVLNAAGFRLYHVETTNGESIIVVSRTNVKNGQHLNLRSLNDDVYLQVTE